MSGVHVSKGEPTRVVVEFSKERAAYARGRTWHRTQEIEEQRDGSVRIAFACRNIAPLVSWILEWGPHAKVIEPRELVQPSVASYDKPQNSIVMNSRLQIGRRAPVEGTLVGKSVARVIAAQ
jgi:predicted DNA-binding transcriptional regulator YafY